MKFFLFLFAFFASSVSFSAEKLTFLPYEKNEFQPVKEEIFSIPFYLPYSANVEIDIFTPDGDLVRKIDYPIKLKGGEHLLSWDGKDHDENIVPNEAYYPVLHAKNDSGTTESFSPRQTGGEITEGVTLEITNEKNVSFKLPYPARVLSRLGIKGGPMLRALSNWEPKNKGKITLRWDGFDHDKLRDLRANKDITFMLAAYKLPEYSIVTSGNTEINYVEYRNKLNLKEKAVALSERKLERDGQRIEQHYYEPKDIILSPDVQLKFKKDYPKNKKGDPTISCPCDIQVDMSEANKTQLQESLYEIAFFIDDEFVSEQEQGYVPLTWRWNPPSLTKGEHILTVNVSGLRGEVGVKSLRFVVE